ncbi:hypothetical protein F0U60_27740 [Archangium minus]|uniref:Uncharacterized protein n=1 Tax=Archangium minus TaxID=83450 RepID=A0ABY9WWG9_9BACT|nr:hypothetical protein F0U60_27740 [Archangium minus]
MPRRIGSSSYSSFVPPSRSERTSSSRPERYAEVSPQRSSRYSPPPGRPVDVYRVEGPDNQRLSFNSYGDPHISKSFNSATNSSRPNLYDKPMAYQDRAFLNFGDRARAEEFLAVRHDQGHRQTVMKGFQVPYDTFDSIRKSSVPESAARDPRYQQRPIQVDVNKGDHQYGLNWQSLQQVNSTAVPGSGRVIQRQPDMVYHPDVSYALQDLYRR